MRGIEIMEYGARRKDGSSGCKAGLQKTAPVQHGGSQCSAGVRKFSCETSFWPRALAQALNGGELLFLALATCYCNDIYHGARDRRLDVQSEEVEVTAEFGRCRDTQYVEGGYASGTHRMPNCPIQPDGMMVCV